MPPVAAAAAVVAPVTAATVWGTAPVAQGLQARPASAGGRPRAKKGCQSASECQSLGYALARLEGGQEFVVGWS
jgi:hypothetical protein